MKKIISIMFLLLVTSSVWAQNKAREFSVKQLPSSLKIQKNRAADVNLKVFFDLTKVLPQGYVKDASIDYTEIIQKALSANKKVIFPNFPLLINETGLEVSSNSEIYFPEKSVLILKPNSNEHYEVLRLHNIDNAVLYNPVIVGDRDKHKGTAGEWGMGISIRASKNINIYNPKVEKCWGDGIYLGHLKNKQVSNVQIFNAYLNNNRRNGVSITSGNNILLETAVVFNTEGKAPQSGIVIEPSNIYAELNGIVLKNVYTFNNFSSGIQIGGLEKLIGKTKTPINIDIINPIDNGSFDGMFLGRILSPDKLPGEGLKGEIKIINPTWENNINSDITKRKLYGRGPKIEFINLSPSVKKQMWREFKYDKDIVFQD